MVSIGVVRSIEGGTAKVLVEEDAGCCDHCEKDSCDITRRGVETEAVNLAGAKVGQKVKVAMHTYTYVKGALVLYALPVAGLLIGALLGERFLPSLLGGGDPNLSAVAGGVLLFVLSLALVKFFSRRIERKTSNRSVIESIIEE